MDNDELIIKLKLIGFEEDNVFPFPCYRYSYKNLELAYFEDKTITAYVGENFVYKHTTQVPSRLLDSILHVIETYKSTKTDEEALNIFRSLEWKYQID